MTKSIGGRNGRAGRNFVRAALLALAVLMIAQCALADAFLRLGDSGAEVLNVQTRLYDLHYTAKSPTAVFNKYTAAAVRVYQKVNGQTVTGSVDEALYQELIGSGARDYIDIQHEPGGSGAYLGKTQRRLKKLGYYTGAVHRQYTTAVASAVSYFQKANSLSQTGVADARTRAAIMSGDALSRKAYEDKNFLTTVKLGSAGAQVERVQSQLSSLGYYTGKVGVKFNAATKQAVLYFQQANDLTVSGIANYDTRVLLNAGTGKTYAQFKAEQALLPVKLGDSGFAVYLLQVRLKELYYLNRVPNGTFGQATQDSVKKFQKYNDIRVTGTANLATRTKMNSAAAVSRVSVDGILPGDTGDAVISLQDKLAELGYFKGASNGKYGASVTLAVKTFQKANSLTVNGKASPKTLSVLFSGSAVTYDEYVDGAGAAKIEKMIAIAQKLLGKPYSTNAVPPKSFDCSRFTRYVFGKVGISLAGEVATQGRNTNGLKIKRDNAAKNDYINYLKRGDLLYFDTQTEKAPGHAAIYLGKVNGKYLFIHASSSKGKVVVTEFHDWYKERFMWGLRVW